MADLDKVLARNFRLRMLCRDEAKGPVTALCGMDGYLVSSMGQKVVKVSWLEISTDQLCRSLYVPSIWTSGSLGWLS